MADFTRIVKTRDEVRAAATNCFRVANALVDAGKRVRLEACEDDDRTLQQNRFYWGVVLRDISAQAVLCGERWVAEAWHEYGKRKFLGYRIRAVRVAGKKKAVYIRTLWHTPDLSVTRMSKYLDEFIAFGVTDLGVRFTETRWQDYLA